MLRQQMITLFPSRGMLRLESPGLRWKEEEQDVSGISRELDSSCRFGSNEGITAATRTRRLRESFDEEAANTHMHPLLVT